MLTDPSALLVVQVTHDGGFEVIAREIDVRRERGLDVRKHLGDLYAESGQTLQGSFSAVSKPNFASKYSLDSSRRDLHNALLCTALESMNEKWGKKDLAKTAL